MAVRVTFRRADLRDLLQRHHEGEMLLTYFLDTLDTEDSRVVQLAGLLGALDAELVRRDDIIQRVCCAAREGRRVV